MEVPIPKRTYGEVGKAPVPPPLSTVPLAHRGNSQEVKRVDTNDLAQVDIPKRSYGEVSKKIVAAPLDPVEIKPVQLENIGLQEPKMIREFRGESQLDAFSLPPSVATETKNISANHYPSLGVRDPFTPYSSVTLPGAIKGLGVWKDNEIHAIANGSWFKVTPTGYNALSTGMNTAAAWSFCNFQGNFTGINLLGSNGVDAVKKYDGTTVSNLGGAPAGMNFITQHDNRVYGAVGSKVPFSALRKGEDWTTVDDAGEIVIETGNGEDVNGLMAGNRHLIVFKPSSVHELWGTSPSNYRLDVVASDIGLLSNNSKCVVGDMPYWVDRNNIYEYGGSRPRFDFALPVKNYIKRITPGSESKVSCGTDGKNLYISLPIDGATECTTTLEYNPYFRIWTVWKDITASFYNTLVGKMIIGDPLGVIRTFGGIGDGSPVAWKWVSAPFGGGHLSQRLQWYRLWYAADVPIGSVLNIEVSPSASGDADWVLMKTVNGQSGMKTARVLLPLASLANANWLRIRLSGTGPVTVTEIDIQQRELPMY